MKKQSNVKGAFFGLLVLLFTAAGVVWIMPDSPLADVLQNALKSLPVQLVSSEFTTAVTFTLLIREKDVQQVMEALTRVTDGRLETMLEDESFEAWNAETT